MGFKLPSETLEAIKKAAESRPAPFLIHQESNVIVRAFRDYLRQDIGEILIDNPKVLELARQHIAALGRPDFQQQNQTIHRRDSAVQPLPDRVADGVRLPA